MSEAERHSRFGIASAGEHQFSGAYAISERSINLSSPCGAVVSTGCANLEAEGSIPSTVTTFRIFTILFQKATFGTACSPSLRRLLFQLVELGSLLPAPGRSEVYSTRPAGFSSIRKGKPSRCLHFFRQTTGDSQAIWRSHRGFPCPPAYSTAI